MPQATHLFGLIFTGLFLPHVLVPPMRLLMKLSSLPCYRIRSGALLATGTGHSGKMRVQQPRTVQDSQIAIAASGNLAAVSPFSMIYHRSRKNNTVVSPPVNLSSIKILCYVNLA